MPAVTGYDAHAIDRLIGEVFRLYGAIVAAGDAVTAPFGLSSARWQIMGAVEATGGATVAALARQVGVTRQSVQRIVNDMVGDGHLELRDNPQHRRARLIVMTEKGWDEYNAVTLAWKTTAERIDREFGSRDLDATMRLLAELRDDFRGVADAGKRSSTRSKETGNEPRAT